MHYILERLFLVLVHYFFWSIKGNKYKSSVLSKLINALMSSGGNVPSIVENYDNLGRLIWAPFILLLTYLLWCKIILHDAIVNVISFQFSVLFWDPDRLALGVACDDILSDYIVPGHDDTGTVPRAEKGLHVLGQQKSSCCMCPVHIIKSRTINVCDGAVTQKGSTISQVCPDNS